MSTLEAITRKRKSMKKIRLSISVSQQAIDALHRLHEQEPDKSASQIVSEAIRFADTLGMFKPVRRFENDMRVERGHEPKPMGVGKVGSLEDKKEWASLYGGECDGINIKFNKYEVTPTGQVAKNQQVVPMRSMPSTQDEFRKSILGKFATLNQAETAYETQADKGELAPVRVLGKKK